MANTSYNPLCHLLTCSPTTTTPTFFSSSSSILPSLQLPLSLSSLPLSLPLPLPPPLPIMSFVLGAATSLVLTVALLYAYLPYIILNYSNIIIPSLTLTSTTNTPSPSPTPSTSPTKAKSSPSNTSIPNHNRHRDTQEYKPSNHLTTPLPPHLIPNKSQLPEHYTFPPPPLTESEEIKYAAERDEMFGGGEGWGGEGRGGRVKHVAIIMDGNRRFIPPSKSTTTDTDAGTDAGTGTDTDADTGTDTNTNAQAQATTKGLGHHHGTQTLLKTLHVLITQLRIPVVTVYAFSTENWDRDEDELRVLMAVFVEKLPLVLEFARDINRRAKKAGGGSGSGSGSGGIRIIILSTQFSRLPTLIQTLLLQIEEETQCFNSDGTGHTLNIAVSYGGREDCVSAAQGCVDFAVGECLRMVSNGGDDDDEVDDGERCREQSTNGHGNGRGNGNGNGNRDEFRCTISSKLYESHLATNASSKCPPDILIRTSGEQRLSNFMLYQMAYTEFFFVDKLWPEIEREDFIEVFKDFKKGKRERRYGK